METKLRESLRGKSDAQILDELRADGFPETEAKCMLEELKRDRPRYSVSRKGMGGRKRKYSDETLAEVMALVNTGKSLLAVSKEKNFPYVSIRAALKAQKMWPVNVATATPVATPEGTVAA